MNPTITPGIDVALLTFWAFTLFFIVLVFYLRREDRREGYPLEDEFTGRVDRRQSYNYFPPGISRVDAVTINTGQAHTDEVIATGIRTAGYKFLTPESEHRTHFFWLQLRNFDIPDYKMADYIKALKASPVKAGFAYESGSNPDFLSVAQIRSLIKTHLNPEFEPV